MDPHMEGLKLVPPAEALPFSTNQYVYLEIWKYVLKIGLEIMCFLWHCDLDLLRPAISTPGAFSSTVSFVSRKQDWFDLVPWHDWLTDWIDVSVANLLEASALV